MTSDKLPSQDSVQYLKERVFMGSGIYSQAACGHLHRILEESFSILSQIQQAPHPGEAKEVYDVYEADVEEGEYRLEQIAKELYVGLTGEKPWDKKKEPMKTKPAKPPKKKVSWGASADHFACKLFRYLNDKKSVLTTTVDDADDEDSVGTRVVGVVMKSGKKFQIQITEMVNNET